MYDSIVSIIKFEVIKFDSKLMTLIRYFLIVHHTCSYNVLLQIIESFYKGEDGENEELQPQVTNGQYLFNAPTNNTGKISF